MARPARALWPAVSRVGAEAGTVGRAEAAAGRVVALTLTLALAAALGGGVAGCAVGGGAFPEDDAKAESGDARVEAGALCAPGEALGCDQATLRICGEGGRYAEALDCGPAGCDPARKRCNQCAPQEPARCSGARVIRCSPYGTFVSEEPCTHGCQSDESGAWCNECAPGTTECRGDTRVECDPDGRIASSQDCDFGCGGAPARCHDCPPQQTGCVGDDLVVCDAAGRIVQATACARGCDPQQAACRCVADECLDADRLRVCGEGGVVQGVEICPHGCYTEGGTGSGTSPGRCNECVPGSRFCVGDDLQICGSDGLVVSSQGCPAGCNPAAAPPRCFTFDPLLADEVDLHGGSVDLAPTADVQVMTDLGTFFENGVPLSIPDFYVGLQGGSGTGPELLVVRLRDVHIPWGVTVSVTGSRGLVLVASGTIRVEGVIDAAAHGNLAGPAGRQGGDPPWSYTPAGGDGAGPGACASCELYGAGAGGGGHAAPGGAGGALAAGATWCPGGAGGPRSGDGSLSPVTGGFPGGHRRAAPDAGAGGGVVALVARERIEVARRWLPAPLGFYQHGRVDVSGGAGQGYGAGGGAGGSILLEAPAVHLYGALHAVGGGGGCGAGAAPGQDGRRGGSGCADPAAGTRGGNGALSSGRPAVAGGEQGGGGQCNADSAGGGGGAAGRVRIRVSPLSGSFQADTTASVRAHPCHGSVFACVETLATY